MEAPPVELKLRARWVIPIATPPIRDGIVTVTGGVISAIGDAASSADATDLGDVALLPAFVNAHTHLEFSGLSEPLGRPGMRFADWLREVIGLRRQSLATLSLEQQSELRRQALEAGLAECRRHGVSTIGEIATPGWPAEPFQAGAINVVMFQELIGLASSRTDDLLALSREHLNRGRTPGVPWIPGISPHAPYTVSPGLIERVCALSAESQVPVAMHLAESIEELELLRSHSGPLWELLVELGAWDASAVPRGIRPLDYLSLLSAAKQALVIHGSYLAEDEIAFLSEHRDHMSVVYCPRTHAYFHAGEHPLRAMLGAGVRVAIGTDSRASNPDLDVLAELRFVAQRYPDLDPSVILRFGTLDAAQALGVDDRVGSLEIGKCAEMVALPLANSDDRDPCEQLLNDHAATAACISVHPAPATIGCHWRGDSRTSALTISDCGMRIAESGNRRL